MLGLGRLAAPVGLRCGAASRPVALAVAALGLVADQDLET
jgi:hypothetical protein